MTTSRCLAALVAIGLVLPTVSITPSFAQTAAGAVRCDSLPSGVAKTGCVEPRNRKTKKVKLPPPPKKKDEPIAIKAWVPPPAESSAGGGGSGGGGGKP
jgi:hypothetical protein